MLPPGKGSRVGTAAWGLQAHTPDSAPTALGKASPAPNEVGGGQSLFPPLRFRDCLEIYRHCLNSYIVLDHVKREEAEQSCAESLNSAAGGTATLPTARGRGPRPRDAGRTAPPPWARATHCAAPWAEGVTEVTSRWVC